jgi:hypothetical protein
MLFLKKNHFVNKVLVAVCAVAMLTTGSMATAIKPVEVTVKVPTTKTAHTVAVKPTSVGLQALLKNPMPYLHKPVVFSGTFSTFSSLGLDYKPALREAKNYVTILLFRPDVLPEHKIPLSEVKIFIRRKESEKLPDLETNDVVTIEGIPFSTALGDVWVDLTKVTVTQKTPRKPVD